MTCFTIYSFTTIYSNWKESDGPSGFTDDRCRSRSALEIISGHGLYAAKNGIKQLKKAKSSLHTGPNTPSNVNSKSDFIVFVFPLPPYLSGFFFLVSLCTESHLVPSPFKSLYARTSISQFFFLQAPYLYKAGGGKFSSHTHFRRCWEFSLHTFQLSKLFTLLILMAWRTTIQINKLLENSLVTDSMLELWSL